jgi:hypothetical protein
MILFPVTILTGFIVGTAIYFLVFRNDEQVRVVTDIKTGKPMQCRVLNDETAKRYILLKGSYIVCDKAGKYKKIDYINLSLKQKQDAAALSVLNR